MKNLLLIFITTILLTGCASMKIEDFNNTKPEFVPQDYFNGKLRAYGIVKDRSGKIIRSFKGEMIGSWDKNGVGTLDEFFVYDDGEEMKRVWTLKPVENKKFIATADDIVGESPMIANGNTVMIDYIMRTPYKSSTIDLSVQDWLHLQDEKVIINHSKMKKFGFVVGELVITIIKE
ncbi:DUF3833 domain-containing protein [Aliarcobacter skirrowii]|uniref:DUF3833 domain-containing protein n=1 Tax=Aliarcobacter skirrowii TaxID=28200 RepID=UPI000D621724|nr:DUF3833 domain-containing protein [Aliarcobacter skirrowii]MDX4026043.1 DUF3833 domain-containing protein [Aliarcobacter skirrowii]MDX4037791.1 DUF3833 domain-containing protein [Aliarcobacter skirrowii]MDX4048559.1 DUF3833 domain-containing protein [Aliarcobacter skirrowii]MDX4057778.1 DUF3833 domain-containing protein [Aliarcobacter skirrowii]MDX4065460.1 DUF3833 domain-containing protein [Aliarcobacter skirrowii]